MIKLKNHLSVHLQSAGWGGMAALKRKKSQVPLYRGREMLSERLAGKARAVSLACAVKSSLEGAESKMEPLGMS